MARVLAVGSTAAILLCGFTLSDVAGAEPPSQDIGESVTRSAGPLAGKVRGTGSIAREDSPQRRPSARFDEQWPLNTEAAGHINVGSAWEMSEGEGITVAVIDSGVDRSHETFRGEGGVSTPFEEGYNFYTDSTDTNEILDEIDNPFYHGTAVAALIAAPSGGPGMTGVAPRATILPIYGPLPRAVRFAVERNVDVINISLSSWESGDDLPEALREAEAAGIPVVVAAANLGCNVDDTTHACRSLARFASTHSNVIAVTSIGSDGRFYREHTWGVRSVALAAPGYLVDVPLYPSANGIQNYGRSIGTSLAAPHVSGVVALMRDVNPSLSPSRIRDILVATATPEESLVGRTAAGGFLDAGAAVARAAEEVLDDVRMSLRASDERSLAFQVGDDGAVRLVEGSVGVGQAFDVQRVANGLYMLASGHAEGTYLGYDPARDRIVVAAPADGNVIRWHLRMQPDQGSYHLQPFGYRQVRVAFEGGVASGARVVPRHSELAAPVELVPFGGGLHDGPAMIHSPNGSAVLSGPDGVELRSSRDGAHPWVLEWVPREAAYRLGWWLNPAARLSVHDGHARVGFDDSRRALWVPRRAANGSTVLFHAEDTARALTRSGAEDGDRVDLAVFTQHAATGWRVSDGCTALSVFALPSTQCSSFVADTDSLEGKRVTIRPAASRALSVTAPSSHLADSGEYSAQQFQIAGVGDGEFTFFNPQTDRYLSWNGSEVGTAAADAGETIHWAPIPGRFSGSYYLSPAGSPHYVSGTGELHDGDPLRLADYDDDGVVEFDLTPIGGQWGSGEPFGGVSGENQAIIKDPDTGKRITSHGGSEVTLESLAADEIQFQSWKTAWNPVLGGYRILSMPEAGAAMSNRANHNGIQTLELDAEVPRAHWVPHRAANGSYALFSVENPQEALVRSAGRGLVREGFSFEGGSRSGWLVDFECGGPFGSVGRSSMLECDASAGREPLADQEVTIRTHHDRKIGVDLRQEGIRYQQISESPTEKFEVVAEAGSSAYVVKNVSQGTFLAVREGVVGLSPDVSDSSRWELLPAGDGSYLMALMGRDVCIVGGFSTSSPVVAGSCERDTPVPFAFVPYGGPLGSMTQISFMAGNKQVIDAAGSEGRVFLGRDHGGKNQKLTPEWDKVRGAYRFVVKSAETDLTWGSKSQGDGVGHWANSDADDHYWIVRHDGGAGTVFASYKDPSMVLQYPANAMGNVVTPSGGAITVGRYAGASNQRWNVHGPINAISSTATSDEYWLFKGDRYVRYDNDGDAVIAGTLDATIAQGWPGLRRHPFANGIDAMTHTGTEAEYWMFKGDRYIRYSTKSESIIAGTHNKTIAEGWPGLRGHPFANGIDAMSLTDTAGEYWMFKGDQYIRYSTKTDSVMYGTKKIADGWPGLRGHKFAAGIDAMTHASQNDEYWMFSGDRYVRYSTKTGSIIGVKDQLIWEGWPGLRKW